MLARIRISVPDSPGSLGRVRRAAPSARTGRSGSQRRCGSVRLAVPGTDRHYRGSALVPIGDGPLGLLLVRADGVDFHRRELWRLSQVGSVLGAVMAVGV